MSIICALLLAVAIERFSMPAEQNGMMLSYIGAISLFMQGMGIAVAMRFLAERNPMIASTFALTLSYYVLVREARLRCVKYRVFSDHCSDKSFSSKI